MFVKKVTRQSRNDFWAVFECEHCHTTANNRGYSDGYFYTNVIPFSVCPSCGLQGVKGKETSLYDNWDIISKRDLPEGYNHPDSYYAGEPKEAGWKMEEMCKDEPILW